MNNTSATTKTKANNHKLSPWLGHIHYKDAGGRDVIARGAVWCDSREEFDVKLEAHLSDQGASFLWSEEVFEATDWLRKHGHNGLMAGLARKVDGMSPVALSDPKAAHDDKVEDDSYLIIEEIEGVEPLDMQMGVYPKLTVPAALQEAMFGQPKPSDAEVEAAGGNPENVPPMATYAILDAAKMPYLLTGELEFSGLEYQSLFQGNAQEELKEHAPYIVRLEDGNDFTRKLFTDLKPPLGFWEKEFGIFIRSRASLAELRKHFRKFTKAQDGQENWYYFRFWEPRHLSNILKMIREDILNSPFFYRFFGGEMIYEFIALTSLSKKRMRINSAMFSEKSNSLVHSKSVVKYIERGYLETSFEETALIALKQAKNIGIDIKNDHFLELLPLCRKLYEDGFTIKGDLAKLCFYKLVYNGKFDDNEINMICELSIDTKDKIIKIEELLFEPLQANMIEEIAQ